jgi:hypothetical protein
MSGSARWRPPPGDPRAAVFLFPDYVQNVHTSTVHAMCCGVVARTPLRSLRTVRLEVLPVGSRLCTTCCPLEQARRRDPTRVDAAPRRDPLRAEDER